MRGLTAYLKNNVQVKITLKRTKEISEFVLSVEKESSVKYILRDFRFFEINLMEIKMTSISSVSPTPIYIPPVVNVSLPTNTNTGTLVIDGEPIAGSGTPAGSTIAAGSSTTVNTFA